MQVGNLQYGPAGSITIVVFESELYVYC